MREGRIVYRQLLGPSVRNPVPCAKLVCKCGKVFRVDRQLVCNCRRKWLIFRFGTDLATMRGEPGHTSLGDDMRTYRAVAGKVGTGYGATIGTEDRNGEVRVLAKYTGYTSLPRLLTAIVSEYSLGRPHGLRMIIDVMPEPKENI